LKRGGRTNPNEAKLGLGGRQIPARKRGPKTNPSEKPPEREGEKETNLYHTLKKGGKKK